MSDMLNRLQRMMGEFPKDPLLEKGIGRDWVCVVNYPTAQALRHEFKRPSFAPPFYQNDLDSITGRRTYTVSEAPDGVEYMTLPMLVSKYPDFWLREMEAAAKLRKDRETGDTDKPQNE